MSLRHYVAIIDQEPGEQTWSILFPDFPEIASVAEREEDWGPQAYDALLTAVEARKQDGEAIPSATSIHNFLGDRPGLERGYPMLVAVDVG